jgi:hypothetical protein
LDHENRRGAPRPSVREGSRLAHRSRQVPFVLNRSTEDWYTQSAATRVCSMAMRSTAVVTTGS